MNSSTTSASHARNIIIYRLIYILGLTEPFSISYPFCPYRIYSDYIERVGHSDYNLLVFAFYPDRQDLEITAILSGIILTTAMFIFSPERNGR